MNSRLWKSNPFFAAKKRITLLHIVCHRPLQSLVTKVQMLNHFWSCAAAEFDILLSFSLMVYQNCGDLVISANTIVSGSKTVPSG
jgi:hypothetical protein